MTDTTKSRTPSANLAADRACALALTPVSRETARRLDRFVELLLQWQQKTNLIADSTVPTIWTRHIADSLQLLALAPEAKCWVDLGSGAGFPGIVIACAVADEPGAAVHLVESNAKKAAFLRETARELHLPARVHAVRVEDFVKTLDERPDAITARALAPLSKLFELAHPLLKTGAKGLFPKGQDVDAELTEASKCWSMKVELVPSKTNSQARIVIISSLQRRNGTE